ncbi:hypothetical protein pEaSNUABM40_00073 [Erwinia phage pEa_SNUABM_40]|uniref:Uncharacterized protein n=1 Tax=Erwinia phage pEa_SNUABM_3 TaxID=2869552 RepID=A0AAE7XJ31_9CAUD|nr:hypothetical protein MPK68_gp073 [Erwinia phage pEa_SNUABM_3]QZE56609.1 hypothetical protein pEaSNUABM20_00073 [Erwinia phage pEa_SNUABM_20]QZE58289.1 hypothetical protein pEaSNUABM40_00073 [Erwinia phage pEa_SNUABM_40]UAW52854.1 hypothetical protein pEaSNUABM23_00072 [Erwinia phage pEa_SNUABM_23]UIW10750.1 hypothetical protein pEaSNUABM23_00072 [Erwinia phage pEa_SNUABM_31]QZE56270.1 hypothetical protein pEaSNUABM3_00073 [Erwinia phage pEa_SNUABM_3]
MVSKVRKGGASGDTLPAAGKRVTAPVYNGAVASSVPAPELRTAVPCKGQSLAGALYSRIDSLHYAVSSLTDTLTRMGVYSAPPAAEDKNKEGAGQHENILRILNEDLNYATTRAGQLLIASIYDREDPTDDEEGEDADKQPSGPILRTAYGRSIYNDCEALIERLLIIQRNANDVGASFVGEGPESISRGSRVTDSVHACVSNLADHVEDTIGVLHRINADLAANILGETEQ